VNPCGNFYHLSRQGIATHAHAAYPPCWASRPQATAYLALQHPGFITFVVTNKSRELLPRVFTLTLCGLRQGGLFSATLSITGIYYRSPSYSGGGLLYVVRTFLLIRQLADATIERPALIQKYEKNQHWVLRCEY
jgi:hypothetical protein